MIILQKAQGFVDALKDEHLQQRFIQNWLSSYITQKQNAWEYKKQPLPLRKLVSLNQCFD